jgi:hypothetical protein
MLTTRKRNRNLFLLAGDELVMPSTWDEIGRSFLPHFLLTLWWTENFLTRPSPDLGRAGPVCPFVRPALEKKSLWLTAIEGAVPGAKLLEETLLGYKDWFLELPPTDGDDAIFKAILILLPDVKEENYRDILDSTQKRLKPAFIKEELMVGQFHPRCDEPGVRNAAFRPLRSPVPLLAIRRITAGDFVFMKGPEGYYNAEFLQNFLRIFAKGLPSSLTKEILQGLASTEREMRPPPR